MTGVLSYNLYLISTNAAQRGINFMISNDFWVLLAMLLYFIVVVVIGFVYAKRSNASSEDYFLGGRGLGLG